MTIPLSGAWEWLFLALIVLGGVLLLLVNIGLGVASDKLWRRLRRGEARAPRFPWSDRTDT
jgi:hypothetical protein